jgi:hypothetical protein
MGIHQDIWIILLMLIGLLVVVGIWIDVCFAIGSCSGAKNASLVMASMFIDKPEFGLSSRFAG